MLYNHSKLLLDINSTMDQLRPKLLKWQANLSGVNIKDDDSLVSAADKDAEDFILSQLSAIYPDADFLAEEGGKREGESGSSDLRFIIDPIDGTTNYIYGNPVYCCSIAAEVNNVVVVGAIDVPRLDMRFEAELNSGALMNGKKIVCSNRKSFSEALFASGFSTHKKEQLQEQVGLLYGFLSQTRGMRRSGSAAFDLCMVAQGVLDFYFELGLQPWDTAAGWLIVKEAGGEVRDYKGNDYHYTSSSILAIQPAMLEKVVELLIRQSTDI